MDATGRIVGWVGLLMIVWVTLRGSAGTYLSLLGI